MTPEQVETVVIGAGPFGLAAGAHLRDAGVEVRVLGEPMAYWERHMPAGMLLRSPCRASSIASPGDRWSLEAYEREIGRRVPRPIPRDVFIAYGRWYQDQALPDLDPRRVRSVRLAPGGFSVELSDGEQLAARRVVLATGLDGHAWRPPPFDALPEGAASHTADHQDLSPFAGRRVLVVGAGQSAIESAALVRECGADVQVLTHSPVHWLTRSARLRNRRVGNMLYAPHDIGPAGLSWLVGPAGFVRRLPTGVRMPLTARCIRPAASDWLITRMHGVTTVTGDAVAVRRTDGHVRVALRNGRELTADHVLLGTGFRPTVAGTGILAPELMHAIRSVQGYPELGPGFETSVPGLHLVGALATYSFGPVMRFVAGTWYTAPALARVVLRPTAPEAAVR